MTPQEIKNTLEARGILLKDFAAKLKINPTSFSAILAGTRPLTAQLESHISLLLETPQTVHPCIYTVSLPSGVVHDCLPTWDSMTEEERGKALVGVVEKVLERLAKLGEDGLTPEQVDSMRSALDSVAAPVTLQVKVEETGFAIPVHIGRRAAAPLE